MSLIRNTLCLDHDKEHKAAFFLCLMTWFLIVLPRWRTQQHRNWLCSCMTVFNFVDLVLQGCKQLHSLSCSSTICFVFSRNLDRFILRVWCTFGISLCAETGISNVISNILCKFICLTQTNSKICMCVVCFAVKVETKMTYLTATPLLYRGPHHALPQSSQVFAVLTPTYISRGSLGPSFNDIIENPSKLSFNISVRENEGKTLDLDNKHQDISTPTLENILSVSSLKTSNEFQF